MQVGEGGGGVLLRVVVAKSDYGGMPSRSGSPFKNNFRWVKKGGKGGRGLLTVAARSEHGDAEKVILFQCVQDVLEGSGVKIDALQSGPMTNSDCRGGANNNPFKPCKAIQKIQRAAHSHRAHRRFIELLPPIALASVPSRP